MLIKINLKNEEFKYFVPFVRIKINILFEKIKKIYVVLFKIKLSNVWNFKFGKLKNPFLLRERIIHSYYPNKFCILMIVSVY